MYSRGELFMRSREGYFGVYFPSCAATREINTKITLEWARKQFVTRVHLGVCGVTAMTENEVSISILSWYHKINFELGVLAKPNCFSVAQV